MNSVRMSQPVADYCDMNNVANISNKITNKLQKNRFPGKRFDIFKSDRSYTNDLVQSTDRGKALLQKSFDETNSSRIDQDSILHRLGNNTAQNSKRMVIPVKPFKKSRPAGYIQNTTRSSMGQMMPDY